MWGRPSGPVKVLFKLKSVVNVDVCFHCCRLKEDVSNDIYFKVLKKETLKITEDFRDFTLYFGLLYPKGSQDVM